MLYSDEPSIVVHSNADISNSNNYKKVTKLFKKYINLHFLLGDRLLKQVSFTVHNNNYLTIY